MSKTYSTYDEINRDLEILKVEKDLAYQKFLKEIDETKESFQPKNIIGETPVKIFNFLGSISAPIKGVALTYLLKRFFK